MISFYNNDNAFFTIDVSNPAAKKVKNISGQITTINFSKPIEKEVISFEVDEEIGKITRGAITFFDRDGIYSQIFRLGVKFRLIWGYKNSPLQDISSISKNIQDTVRNGSNVRYLDCFCVSPTGSGSGRGVIVYTIQFYATEFLKNKVKKVWDSGTRGSMIRQILSSQLDITDMYINFTKSTVKLNKKTAVNQNAEPFTFLRKQSIIDNALFAIGYDRLGKRSCFYVDSSRINELGVKTLVRKWTGSVSGFLNKFVYGIEKKGFINVSNFSWSQNVGDNGTGDNVQVFTVNGQPAFFRSVAGQQTGAVYTFDAKRVEQILKHDPRFESFSDLLTNDFDQLVNKRIFVKVKIETSPEGFGFTVNATTVKANPNMVLSGIANFFDGFPSNLQNGPTFYIKSIKHTIDKNAYRQSLVVADAVVITGGSLVGIDTGQRTL